MVIERREFPNDGKKPTGLQLCLDTATQREFIQCGQCADYRFFSDRLEHTLIRSGRIPKLVRLWKARRELTRGIGFIFRHAVCMAIWQERK